MKKLIAFATLAASCAAVAHAETVTYAYDALGRLVAVTHAGGGNDGRQTGYAYDAADNRASVTNR